MVMTGRKVALVKPGVVLLILASLVYGGGRVYTEYALKTATLKKIIERLQADSRIAEVVVTDVQDDPVTRRQMTTIKFLEYAADGQPLPARYFTFPGNVIQFQSLVIRFNDLLVGRGDPLRGRSAYLFWKVFRLDGPKTEEYPLAVFNEVPAGYKISGTRNPFEEKLWQEFWRLALDPKSATNQGVKNAQIEAPGTRFIPGVLYTLRIEHDGGIRIDAKELPAILKGETIPR